MHKIAPNADTIIILKHPIAHFAVWEQTTVMHTSGTTSPEPNNESDVDEDEPVGHHLNKHETTPVSAVETNTEDNGATSTDIDGECT